MSCKVDSRAINKGTNFQQRNEIRNKIKIVRVQLNTNFAAEVY